MSATKQIAKWDKKLKRVVWFTPGEKGRYHAVHQDTIPPTESYATDEGKIFESKSALFAHYKEHGYECTGGDHLTGKGLRDEIKVADREEIRADVAEAKRQIEWGMAPCTELERHTWQKEEKKYQEYLKTRN